jgi:hypothetical protein
MRLATVVSQATGEWMAARSSGDIAYQRAYASCTTSSASAKEPSSRYARLISRRRSLMVASLARSDETARPDVSLT